jgi:sigma-E factor negative regulatory protein RseB
LAALPQGARGADDPRVWLEKMNKALATRNYDGTFFHISGGRVETMRIVHRVRAGRVSERLQSLDGSRREFVRANDELTCYLPDQHTVLEEPRQDRGPFLGSLPQFDQSVGEFYRIEALASTHILGRPARVIAVYPKDQYRFGYRLWLDEKTAMPLKTQLCDPQGQVIEQIFFARLDMPESIPDSDLAPTVRTEGMRWVRQGPSIDAASAALADYRASQLPPGFRLTVQGAQTLGGASAPASHLVYSDGLATVSVFVEEQRGQGLGAPAAGTANSSAAAAGTPGFGNPTVSTPEVSTLGVSTPGVSAPGVSAPGVSLEPDAQAPLQGLARVGSGYAYSTVVQGHQVTAVGEVPAQTVEFIAHSVKIYGGAEIPHR